MNDLDDRLKRLLSRSREGKHFEEIRLSNKTPTGDGKEGQMTHATRFDLPCLWCILWQDTSKCFYPGGNINTLQASLDGLVLYSGSSNGRTFRLGRFCWIISALAVMNAAASDIFLRLDSLVTDGSLRICRVWVEKMTSGSCFSQPGWPKFVFCICIILQIWKHIYLDWSGYVEFLSMTFMAMDETSVVAQLPLLPVVMDAMLAGAMPSNNVLSLALQAW